MYFNEKTMSVNASFGTAAADAVLYTEQELNADQQAQARANIGAANFAALNGMTIEGFARTLGFADVKNTAIKHAGAYAYRGAYNSSVNRYAIATYDNIATWNYYEIPVVEGEVYYIHTAAGATPNACYLLDDSNYIQQMLPAKNPTGNTACELEFTVPANVTKMYVNECQQVCTTEIKKQSADAIAFKVQDRSIFSNDHLTGKKLACVGDSITEATNPDGGYFTNYAEIVAARHGMTVYKDGKGGTTMTNVDGKNPFCVSRYLSVPADFDILTIWFGWNDAAYATVGTIDDTEDTTYYGAYKKVLEHFIATYPTKKIGLIVPYGNSSVEPFRAAVRNLSEMYGVPCLDLADGKQCSLLWGTDNDAQLARRAALTYDGTHPNQAGHEYLSTMYEEFIKRL